MFDSPTKPNPAGREHLKRGMQKAIEAERREHLKEEPAAKPSRPLLKFQGGGRYLDHEPEPQEFIFKDCLPADIVGVVQATGGTGKTTLMLELAIALATGEPFGPFIPTRPYKVLFIGGEDKAKGLHRRIYRAVHAMGCAGPGNQDREQRFRDNFDAVSLVGENRVMIDLDANGNARTSDVYKWLSDSIGHMPGVEIVMIDPLNRFYGQNENDSAMASFWVSMLEGLVLDQDLKLCLFSHHISKADRKDGSVRTLSGRGSGAFTDNARFCLSIAPMTTTEGRDANVNPADYVSAWIFKNNDGPKWASEEYFKRGEHGILEPVELKRTNPEARATTLVRALVECGTELTRRDLEKGSTDKKKGAAVAAIRKNLKENHRSEPRDIGEIITTAKRMGLLRIEKKTIRGGTASFLVPTGTAFSGVSTDEADDE